MNHPELLTEMIRAKPESEDRVAWLFDISPVCLCQVSTWRQLAVPGYRHNTLPVTARHSPCHVTECQPQPGRPPPALLAAPRPGQERRRPSGWEVRRVLREQVGRLQVTWRCHSCVRLTEGCSGLPGGPAGAPPAPAGPAPAGSTPTQGAEAGAPARGDSDWDWGEVSSSATLLVVQAMVRAMAMATATTTIIIDVTTTTPPGQSVSEMSRNRIIGHDITNLQCQRQQTYIMKYELFWLYRAQLMIHEEESEECSDCISIWPPTHCFSSTVDNCNLWFYKLLHCITLFANQNFSSFG